jgi:Ca2+-binding RTX toxin-like protein
MPAFEVRSDLHVLPGELMTFTSNGDTNFFIQLFAPAHPGTLTASGPYPSLTNDGEIRFTSSGHINSFLIVHDMVIGGGNTILNRGLMQLDARTGSAGLIHMGNGRATVRNEGVMVVNAEVDAHILREYYLFDVVNSGTMTVTAGGYAFGLISMLATQLTNTGLISVTSTERSAWGVSCGNGDGSWVINSGTISAQATGEVGFSIGVSMGSAYEDVLLENTGTIRGDASVTGGGDSLSGRLIIRNTGTLDGEVLLGASRADVRNSGLIIGDVSLGASDDVFDGTGGTVTGSVYGEAGDDLIVAGAGADRLEGGEGDDQLDGGGGDNVLRGANGEDVLVSGAGNDRIDGGADFDIVDYSNATAGVQINLGSALAQDTGGRGVDTLASIEGVRGSAFDDHLTADARPAENPGILIKTEGVENKSIAEAVLLDGLFALREDLDFEDFLTTPHVVVSATNWGGPEYYEFTVSAAGEVGRFDIDQVDYSWNLYLRLFDSAGNLIHINYEGPEDAGSLSPADPYLVYTFANPGTYYIAVDQQTLQPLNRGVQYTLNVGLSHAPVTSGELAGSSLWGGAGSDVLVGGDGDDMLEGGAGDDTIMGGGGWDSLVLQGGRNDYQVLRSGDDFIVKGVDGSDWLSGVELLRFSDGGVLDLAKMYGLEPMEPPLVSRPEQAFDDYLLPGQEAEVEVCRDASFEPVTAQDVHPAVQLTWAPAIERGETNQIDGIGPLMPERFNPGWE